MLKIQVQWWDYAEPHTDTGAGTYTSPEKFTYWADDGQARYASEDEAAEALSYWGVNGRLVNESQPDETPAWHK